MSSTITYEFYYDYKYPKEGSKLELYHTSTDSFVYEIKSNIFCERCWDKVFVQEDI